MLQFFCPHCQQMLQILPQHLGLRGHCKKCGGRIALLGKADPDQAQWASIVEGDPPEPQDTRPATPRQIQALAHAGIPVAQLQELTRTGAEALFRQLRAKQQAEPPTEKQLAHLKRLGAKPEQLEVLLTKQDAGALIEEMHLQPTRAQLDLLKKLGAGGEQMARLRSRGEASALIESLQSSR